MITKINFLIRFKIIKKKDAEEMDRADEELKETVKHLWPLQSIKKLDLVVPPKECNYNLKNLN